MSSSPLVIKENSYSTDTPPSDMPTYTVNIHTCWSSATPCRELLSHCSCNIYACWHSLTATNTTAVKHAYLMLAGPLPLDQHACQPIATQPCMSAGVVLLYLPYLLAWCLTISNVCCCGASPYAMPSGVVPHYRSCPLVWCLIISHVCWVWCLTICHAFWCGASL